MRDLVDDLLRLRGASCPQIAAAPCSLTMCEPYERQIARLDAIPGFGVATALDLIAEMGVDMSVFPTAGHLASWARQTPRVTESAGQT
jgi:transposase